MPVAVQQSLRFVGQCHTYCYDCSRKERQYGVAYASQKNGVQFNLVFKDPVHIHWLCAVVLHASDRKSGL